MLLENIPLGKTLEIYIEREDYRYRLVSKVEDVNEKRVCVTAISSRKGKYFSFRPEDQVRVLYRDQETMWEWSHVEAGLAMLEGMPVHYFVMKDKGQKFNRRNAYRVGVREDITIRYYNDSDTGEKQADIPEGADLKGLRAICVEGMVKDVSESGVGISCDEEFEINDSVFFEIPCAYGNLRVKALVVRKNKLEMTKSRYDYYYGCVLLKSDRRLTRFIFDLQRELLKKQREKEVN